MKLLAFETSTEACSVALWLDGEVRERYALAPRQHAELILPWAEALLAEAGLAKSALDAVAVGRGPGAFTGVRLAIALAQGVALALDRPTVPVSTLAALAMRALDDPAPTGEARHVLAAIDARMHEVYAAPFAVGEGDAVALGPEIVIAPDALDLPDAGDWWGVGTGLAAVDAALERRLRAAPGLRLRGLAPEALPHAADVARLAARAYFRGGAVAPERLEPAYLRNQVALTLAEQAAARAARSGAG